MCAFMSSSPVGNPVDKIEYEEYWGRQPQGPGVDIVTQGLFVCTQGIIILKLYID